ALSGETLNFTLATTAETGSIVGNYPITVSLGSNPNYNVTKSDSTLTVNPASLSITAGDAGKTYGQTVAFAGTEFTAPGLVNGDVVSAVQLSSDGAAATAGVGSYNIV